MPYHTIPCHTIHSLTTGSVITDEALAPVLDQTRLHLIDKNVAADISQKVWCGMAWYEIFDFLEETILY